ncbi:hypothetical protein D3C86_1685530 [compost metagenome]
MLELRSVTDRVKAQPLVQIQPEQVTSLLCVLTRQKSRAEEFRADGVGFRFLVVLAQIVAIHRHGEAEANQQGQQCQHGTLDDAVARIGSLCCIALLKQQARAEPFGQP